MLIIDLVVAIVVPVYVSVPAVFAGDVGAAAVVVVVL